MPLPHNIPTPGGKKSEPVKKIGILDIPVIVPIKPVPGLPKGFDMPGYIPPSPEIQPPGLWQERAKNSLAAPGFPGK